MPAILFGISYIVGKLVQSLCFNHLGLSPFISLMGCCGVMMMLFLAGWTYTSGKAR
jgi:hypothetical protein